MTEQQMSLVRLSWASLFARQEEFAQRYYDELFSQEPRLRILFDSFMDEQQRHLSGSLSMIINRLDDQEKLRAELKQLGLRHKGYGVKGQHFVPVTATALITLERMLGKDFTPSVRESWRAFYMLMERGMALENDAVPAPFSRPNVDKGLRLSPSGA